MGKVKDLTARRCRCQNYIRRVDRMSDLISRQDLERELNAQLAIDANTKETAMDILEKFEDGKVEVTIWLTNGDIIVYYPKKSVA